ncbi:hypothetical protein GQ457_14G000920 [Hibiscus cannabinus]
MAFGAFHGDHRGSRIITLFVGNLSPTMHWRGLRQAFSFHGDVVDSFIANKKDRYGKRFGFVRFSNRDDAPRAMIRLNGFRHFGYHISVSYAKYNSRATYWRKKRLPSKGIQEPVGNKASGSIGEVKSVERNVAEANARVCSESSKHTPANVQYR